MKRGKGNIVGGIFINYGELYDNYQHSKRKTDKKNFFFDILFSLRNNDEQKKPQLKIFIRSRDNCN